MRTGKILSKCKLAACHCPFLLNKGRTVLASDSSNWSAMNRLLPSCFSLCPIFYLIMTDRTTTEHESFGIKRKKLEIRRRMGKKRSEKNCLWIGCIECGIWITTTTIKNPIDFFLWWSVVKGKQSIKKENKKKEMN